MPSNDLYAGIACLQTTCGVIGEIRYVPMISRTRMRCPREVSRPQRPGNSRGAPGRRPHRAFGTWTQDRALTARNVRARQAPRRSWYHHRLWRADRLAGARPQYDLDRSTEDPPMSISAPASRPPANSPLSWKFTGSPATIALFSRSPFQPLTSLRRSSMQ